MIDLRRVGVLAIAPVIGAIAIAIVAGPPSGAVRDVSQVEQAAPAVAVVQPATGTAPAAQPAATTGNAGDGITVHGHWTIVVAEPDGTIVDRREFENALTASGANALVQFLMRTARVGTWSVFLLSNGGTGPQGCLNSLGNSQACETFEAALGTAGSSWQFPTLQVTTLLGGDSLRLNGTVIAGEAATINQVVTRVRKCTGTQQGTQCSGPHDFTDRTFSLNPVIQPVSVQPGQQIEVTVVISFPWTP